MTPTGRQRLAAPALLAFALSVRWLYIWEVWKSESVRYLMVDSRAYHERALSILAGDWLGDRIFYQDPLYPYFLALLYSIFEPGSVWILLVQGLLDAATVLAIYWIAQQLFGDRCALVAGVLAALYRPFVFYVALLEKTTFSLCLFSFALYFLVRADGLRRRRDWLIAGLALGLASLTRGNYLVWLPIAVAWILLSKGIAPSSRIGAIAALVLGLACVVLPVTIRNHYVGNDWVLITSQAGQNFFIGNNRYNDTGIYESPPFLRANPEFEEDDFAREAKRRSGRDMKPSERSRFWFHETLRSIAADPGHFVAHTGRKTRLFFADHEVPDNYSYDFFVQHVSVLLALPLPDYGALLPLAGCGVFFARRQRRAWLLVACFASYAASVIAFYNMSRYRIPAVPIVIVFAALALTRLLAALRARETRVLAAAVVFLVPAYLVVHPRNVEVDFAKHFLNLAAGHRERALEAEQRAEALSLQGDPAAADERARAEALRARVIPELRRGLEIAPDQPALRRALREVLEEEAERAAGRGDYAQAVALAEQLTSAFPRFADGYWQLGSSLARLGRTKEAEAALRQALVLDPRHARARSELEWLKAAQVEPQANGER